MPHGHPDYWPVVIPAMPVAGAGQVPWYQSDEDTVPFGGNVDLINYVVPDDMELHVCSGVISSNFPFHQSYDLRQTPAATWISPTSHSDPDDKWSQEEHAYDGNLATHAYVLEQGHYLVLLLTTPSTCDKIRLYASDIEPLTTLFTNPNVSIDIYYDDAWDNIFSGDITKLTWVEQAFPEELVKKARIKWAALPAGTTYGALKEFQFNTSGVTAQRGIYFDTNAIIPYLPQACYLVPAKATFAVRVYNDDDIDHTASIAIAGFLQNKV